jgi:hypothetical protein
MKKRAACTLVAMAISATLSAATPGAAWATETVAPPSPPKESYSLLVVLSDLAAVGMMASGLGPLQSAGFATYAFAPPVIHLVQGRPGRAAASVGLRLLLPIGGILAGAALETCDPSEEWFCGMSGGALGAAVGMIGASIFDATLLADADDGNTQVPPERGPAPLRVAGVTIDRAGIAPYRNGAGLILGGTF